MNQEERKQMIDEILSAIKENPTISEGISPSMWIIAETDPTNPDWLNFCQRAVDWYYQEHGKRDTESIFAQCLRIAKRKDVNDEKEFIGIA